MRASFSRAFQGDGRSPSKRQGPLSSGRDLLLCLAAVISGAKTVFAIAQFGEMKRMFLRRFKPFKDGTPAHDLSAPSSSTPRRGFSSRRRRWKPNGSRRSCADIRPSKTVLTGCWTWSSAPASSAALTLHNFLHPIPLGAGSLRPVRLLPRLRPSTAPPRVGVEQPARPRRSVRSSHRPSARPAYGMEYRPRPLWLACF